MQPVKVSAQCWVFLVMWKIFHNFTENTKSEKFNVYVFRFPLKCEHLRHTFLGRVEPLPISHQDNFLVILSLLCNLVITNAIPYLVHLVHKMWFLFLFYFHLFCSFLKHKDTSCAFMDLKKHLLKLINLYNLWILCNSTWVKSDVPLSINEG